MTLRERLTVFVGKFISWTSSTLRLGAGATWPGEVALMLAPDILRAFGSQLTHGIILVAGTNGKTTTALMIKTILEKEGFTVVHNKSGANLLNGVVSACIKQATRGGHVKADWGVFEIDENSLPVVLKFITPKSIVLLNLFRDQLDRYGEVDIIAEKWQNAFKNLTDATTLVLNADDPLVSFLGKQSSARVRYFGLNNPKLAAKKMEHATDSTFCLFCGSRLSYTVTYFSHIGDWYCNICGERRPKLDMSDWKSALPGLYNQYNTFAAALTARTCGIPDEHTGLALNGFSPAFGRQEEFTVEGKKIKLYLSKNPAGFNASLRTVLESKPKAILLALNDRIPDGRDVSWIWDVDFETIGEGISIIVSGDRVYDLATRIKYATGIQNSKFKIQNLIIEDNLAQAIKSGLAAIKSGEVLYALPTYSAMLEVRKILTGKKIL